MNKKGARQIYYVCIGMDDDASQFLSKIIAADNPTDASSLYKEETNLEAKEVLGPFYKKRARVLENTRALKFTNQTCKAIYNEWVVNAFFLQEPENQAYLVFLKRTDGKKIPLPKGTIVVPISELRIT